MKIYFLIIGLLSAFLSYAQIGYQVSLLNNATGEPRANEQVDVTVKITDRDNKVICEQTRAEVTNDFGVLSMTVGNSDTFFDADWNKLPFFIEASVDGRMIGKSQILSVPVAEYAKQTGSLTKEILCSKKWKAKGSGDYWIDISFFDNDKYEYSLHDNTNYSNTTGSYVIESNFIIIYLDAPKYFDEAVKMYFYDSKNNWLTDGDAVFK